MNGHREPDDPIRQNRIEPRLGDMEHLDDSLISSPRKVSPPHRDTVQRHKKPTSERGKFRIWIVFLWLSVALLAVAWFNQTYLRNLIPRTELNEVLSRADTALQEGHLVGHDGTSARELYEAAQALSPDNDQAHDGLRKVGLAEIARAKVALKENKLDDASQALASARDLLGGGSDVEQVAQALTQAQSKRVKIATLVDQAQTALNAGSYQSAGGLYKRILTADANNVIALHGLDVIGGVLATQARKALDQNDLSAANDIEKLAELLPNYGDLPALRAQLAQLKQQHDEVVNHLIQLGNAAIRAGHFSGEDENNALHYFQTVLQIDPENSLAQAGLGQVAQALIMQANAALDSDDIKQAAQWLAEAAKLAPKSAELAAMQARLHQPIQSNQQATAVLVKITPAQKARIAQLLKHARAAAQHGHIMLPPGDCAYDLYRSVLALDGNNQHALQGLQQLPELVSRQFEQALAAGKLLKAGDLLSSLNDLSPGDAGQDQLRQRLATAWLDRCVRRLARGDHVGAMHAWRQAYKFDPASSRLQALAIRLNVNGT